MYIDLSCHGISSDKTHSVSCINTSTISCIHDGKGGLSIQSKEILVFLSCLIWQRFALVRFHWEVHVRNVSFPLSANVSAALH